MRTGACVLPSMPVSPDYPGISDAVFMLVRLDRLLAEEYFGSAERTIVVERGGP